MAFPTIDVKDAANGDVTVNTLPNAGRDDAADSLPVVLSNEDLAKLEAIRALLAGTLTVGLPTDAATQTTLAAVLAKLTADPSTATLQTTANGHLVTLKGGATPTDLSSTIAAGGTAQPLLSAATRARVVIFNPDASEDLWVAPFGTTAVAYGQGSICVPAKWRLTLDGPEASTALSIVGATTGHKFTAWSSV